MDSDSGGIMSPSGANRKHAFEPEHHNEDSKRRNEGEDRVFGHKLFHHFISNPVARIRRSRKCMTFYAMRELAIELLDQ